VLLNDSADAWPLRTRCLMTWTLPPQGVPVLGFQCDKFPAFFSAKSPYDCPGRADTFAQVAKAFLAMEQVRSRRCWLVAVWSL
jgi:pseudouridine-5'-phosphate glycosidase